MYLLKYHTDLMYYNYTWFENAVCFHYIALISHTQICTCYVKFMSSWFHFLLSSVKLWASAFGGEIKSIAAKYSGSQLLQKVNGAVLICAVNTTNKTALKDISWYSLKYLVIVMLYAFGDHSVPCYLSKYYHLIPTLCHVLLFKGHTFYYWL